MAMEIAIKELINWMKFWLDIPNYLNSKAKEGKLEKAEVTPSRGNSEKGNPFLEELDLSSNQISSLPYNFFSSMKNLIALNFANNILQNFPTSLSKLDKLMHLDLSGNSLKNVPENMFMNMRELRLINLSENEIKEIKNRTFVGPVFAETVALARNQLVDFPKQALAAFKYVRKLDLSNNSIRYLPPLSMESLIIETVDLSFNSIQEIDSTAFKDISPDSALSVDMSHNSIQYLTVVMFDELVSRLKNFRINLEYNQIRCNCAMERFYEWINTQDESKGFTTITCTHPVGVRGIRLSELRSKDSLICAAPEIVPTAREVTAQKGNNAFLPCYNTAEPIAETSWFFNAEKVVHSPKTKILSSGSLVIREVSEADNGVWTCRASNPRGQDTINILLTVTDCNFSPSTSLTISVIFFISAFILFLITVVFCIYNKRRDATQRENMSHHMELSSNNSLQYNQAPVLPKQADYRIPEFLQTAQNDSI
ncbi:uncharacterized protein LOC142344942 [Convolutriloba macropyga]|uniref:uncharacterized protein LOC142344942 n=1 Tax=Convolutriloba macropyga TaxID=536237 RepID=UPI003F524CFB